MREKFHSRVFAYVALVFVSIVVLFPVLFTLSTAFKTNADAESFPPKLLNFKPKVKTSDISSRTLNFGMQFK